jgi:hypothetical protein
MESYYDDNFGHWDMSGGDTEEMVAFYHEVQKDSVEKICKQCERRVFLRRSYVICNDCADQNERF